MKICSLRQWKLILGSVFILFWAVSGAQAQTPNAADSAYLELLFDSPIIPGNSFVYPQVNDFSDLQRAFDIFKFSADDYLTSYNDLSVTGDTIFSTEYQSEKRVDFILNDSVSSSYAYFIPKTQPDTDSVAFLVIPGSGFNQAFQLLNDPYNYHNINGNVVTLTSGIGDTYVYSQPNEDTRAIIHNGAKLSENAIHTDLLNRNRPYYTTALIECIAYVKYLKRHYKKVIVLGLSQGGHLSLITSLLTEPDGCLVASGYSVLWDESYYAGLGNITIPDFANNFKKEKIKEIMKNQATEYLFSFPDADYQVPVLVLDHNSGNTCSYFNDVSNFECYTESLYHTFPIDYLPVFINKVVSSPKIFLNTRKECAVDSTAFSAKFMNGLPKKVTLYKDTVRVGEFAVTGDSIAMGGIIDTGVYHLTGEYIFDDVVKNYRSANVTVTRNSDLGRTYQIEPFCSSNGAALSFNFIGGTKPWRLFFEDENKKDSVIKTYQRELSIPLNNGQYVLKYITDRENCPQLMNDTLNIRPISSIDIVRNNNFLYATAPLAPYKGKWYRDERELNVDRYSDSMEIKRPGTYYLQLTQTDGCVVNSNQITVIGRDVEVSPNPAPDVINIQVRNGLVGAIVYFYDTFGKFKGKLFLQKANMQFDISSWPSGVYYCQVVDPDNPDTRYTAVKVIKVK